MGGKVAGSQAQAPKFSTGYMDRTADPRKDFYRYAAGSWLDTHPLPPEWPRYGVFNELLDWNLSRLKIIAERCAHKSTGSNDPVVRMIGDFYRSAMDRSRIESVGFRPIEDLWGQAARVSTPDEVAEAIALFHKEGVVAGFSAFSKADDMDSARYAFYLEQGGLSLPDREYYLSENFTMVRKQYKDHIARLFVLKGLPEANAKKWASGVLRVETLLARASRTRTLLRDREKNYNRKAIREAKEKYPTLFQGRYFHTMGLPPIQYVVVGQPEFFERLDALVREGDIDDWSAYLCWRALHSAAPYLHPAVEGEDFDFFHRKLTGQKKQQPRWKRVLRVIDSSIGEALGKLYVEENFPEEARRRANVLVDDLKEVFRERLESIPWMSERTRRQALVKFSRFRTKMGHPQKFRDYSAIRIDPRDYAGNVRRSAVFEVLRQTRRAGRWVDREEWLMTPPTVNAYFDETLNEIVFPAGILQPPFFDHMADEAVNYGAIGVVIGHEITHGYDDQGRKYDSKGNLRDWWTKEDERRFKRRANAVVKAYGGQEILPRLHVNGKLTLGENIADLGGVGIAFEALQRRLANGARGRRKIDGLTPEQRFFISYSQMWRQNTSEMEARRLATVDPHSPSKVRGVLPAKNHPAFDLSFPPKRRESEGLARIGVW
ncbi:MAG TPA: M13 family metallopeptidase [Nitrososphaerales archaeon]|nr:M13 family metallopeptidase [Nitrososphaerales archaeon]